MRIGRKAIIQTILALGAAGSIATSVAVPVAAVATPNVVAVSAVPHSWYHG
jgi:hypothetical protein